MTLRVGSIEIVPLVDTVDELGRLPDLFPGVDRHLWEPFRSAFPSLFAEGGVWKPPFTAYLVRGPGETVLVDAGVGPAGVGAAFLPGRQGRLLAELEAAGDGAADVGVVFLTHLHLDHVGWLLDEGGRVFFPKARHVVNERDLAWLSTRSDPDAVAAQDTVEGLARAGLLDLVPGGEHEIASGVGAFATPGHTPGHMSVEVESDGERAVILGDVAVHPAQVTNPEWHYSWDADAGTAARTRRALVHELADTDTSVLCGHYPGGGVGRIAREGGRSSWSVLSLGLPQVGMSERGAVSRHTLRRQDLET